MHNQSLKEITHDKSTPMKSNEHIYQAKHKAFDESDNYRDMAGSLRARDGKLYRKGASTRLPDENLSSKKTHSEVTQSHGNERSGKLVICDFQKSIKDEIERENSMVQQRKPVSDVFRSKLGVSHKINDVVGKLEDPNYDKKNATKLQMLEGRHDEESRVESKLERLQKKHSNETKHDHTLDRVSHTDVKADSSYGRNKTRNKNVSTSQSPNRTKFNEGLRSDSVESAYVDDTVSEESYEDIGANERVNRKRASPLSKQSSNEISDDSIQFSSENQNSKLSCSADSDSGLENTESDDRPTQYETYCENIDPRILSVFVPEDEDLSKHDIDELTLRIEDVLSKDVLQSTDAEQSNSSNYVQKGKAEKRQKRIRRKGHFTKFMSPQEQMQILNGLQDLQVKLRAKFEKCTNMGRKKIYRRLLEVYIIVF